MIRYIAMCFDRAGAEQRFPMCLASRHSERRRHGDDLSARPRQRAVKRRKAHVVTDRKANLGVQRTSHDDSLIATLERVAFPIGLATAERYIEQIDLIVFGRDLATGIEHEGAVEHLAVAGVDRTRAEQQPHAEFLRGRTPGLELTLNLRRPDCLQHPRLIAIEHHRTLRRRDKARASGRSLAQERHCRRPVRCRIDPRSKLNRGGA
jgi:hypothetical protein